MHEALPWLILSAAVVNLVLVVVLLVRASKAFEGAAEGSARRAAHEPGGSPERRTGAA